MARSFFIPFAIVFLMIASACSAKANQNTSNLSTEEIEKIIDNYIVSNPDVIERAFVALNEKRKAEESAAARGRILANSAKLYTSDMEYVLGDADAPITVVEFFDYQCGYCKRTVEDVRGLVEEFDGKVRVVFRELPILSPESELAAKAALAAANQGKYIDMHIGLMAHKGRLDQSAINAIAFSVGVNLADMERDAKSDDVQAILTKTKALAAELGANGTPAFFVGTTMVSGADIDSVRNAIKAEIKQKGL